VSATEVTQLRFANALDGYAFDPELWETTNGGASWLRVPTPGPVTELEAADGEAYGLACATASCDPMDLLRSPVGSREWQKVSTPASLGSIATFTVSGPSLYVLSANANTRPYVLLYSADKGATFTKRVEPCTAGLGGRVTAAAEGSLTIWAACPTGTEATVLLSTNGGTTWRVAEPTEAGLPNSVGLAAASSSVALVWPGPQFELPAALARTTNGGKSYSAVLSSSARVLWAGFSDPVRAYALLVVTASGPTHLFESNDGGATWFQVEIKS
jgi:photosystem II stability/assembly factor-like uncharacterized protein